MDIGLLSILNIRMVDFHRGLIQGYANALRDAIALHVSGADNHKQKQQGFFLSKKRSLEDKLYVGNIHRIENHLYWNDEELADDDEIVNVVMMIGPVSRDGGACSYGTKDFRDQVMYANTIPQVVGHLFYVNTPGGETACRNDYEMMIKDCREKGKPTVTFVDGMCYSSGVNLASRTDRVVVMNPRDGFGCIGSMAAFWATPDGAINRDGSRWVEVVGDESPEKNAWWREAAKGEYERLKADVNKSTQEFHQTVRENRPLVKDWMLTGDGFEAQDVMGALVDEIGDYNRAIECVFELAEGTLTPAREAVIVPDEPTEEDAPGNQNTPSNQSNQSTQSNQNELNNPQNDTTMTEDEKKAAEVVEQPATTQEEQAPATEQPAEEAPATEAPASEETPAQEGTPADNDSEGAPASEEAPATEKPAGEETPAQEDAAGQAEALATAEAMIAEKDKEIATLKESLATLNGIAQERDAAVQERNDVSASLEKAGQDYAEQGKALADAEAKIAEHVATIAAKDAAIAAKDANIEALQKKVADLQAEVKELSEKPAPMTNADAGVPAGNGTGEAPKVNQHQRVKAGMTYEEIRALKKAGQA